MTVKEERTRIRRETIVKALRREYPDGLRAGQIRALIGYQTPGGGLYSVYLWPLIEAGLIRKEGYGKYFYVDEV